MSTELTARTDVPVDFRLRYEDAYRLELQEWVSAMREGRAPTLATVEDGAQATRVAAAAAESMRSGGGFVTVEAAR